VLRARHKKQKAEMYGTELLYLLVKRYYDGVTAPHEHFNNIWLGQKAQEPDNKIIPNLIKRLVS